MTEKQDQELDSSKNAFYDYVKSLRTFETPKAKPVVGSQNVQRVKIIVQHRLSKLNQIIAENRRKRVKAAEKLQARLELDNQIKRLVGSLGETEPNQALHNLIADLNSNIDKKYTSKDFFRLNHIDESIIAFIDYARRSQLWFDKKLEDYEIDTLFRWLDSEHKPIIDGLKQLIDDFCRKNEGYGQQTQKREEIKQTKEIDEMSESTSLDSI